MTCGPTELVVDIHTGVTVVDVVGEMILGKTQHKDTVEFLVRTDGWACYKWPKNRAPGRCPGKWYVNDHSHPRAPQDPGDVVQDQGSIFA